MLFLLAKYAYITLLCILFGKNILYWAAKYKIFSAVTIPISVEVLVGLVSIGSINAWLSIFIPISIAANLFFVTLSFFLYISNPLPYFEKVNLPRWKKLFLFLAGIFSLYLSAQQSITLDEGMYHAQFIVWHEHFPAVTGLANLQAHLGFNSHWHLLAALFNGAFLTGQESNHINGFLYFWTFTYFIQNIDLKKHSYANSFFLFLAVFLHLPQLLAYYIIAPSADLFVMYAIFICASILFQKATASTVQKKLNSLDFSIILLALFSLTVKISAIPMMGVILYYILIFFSEKKYFSVFVLSSFGIFINGIWVLRNLILTGHLIFPLVGSDPFDFDWKVPAQVVREHAAIIYRYAWVLYKEDAHKELLHLPFPQRFLIWWQYNLT